VPVAATALLLPFIIVLSPMARPSRLPAPFRAADQNSERALRTRLGADRAGRGVGVADHGEQAAQTLSEPKGALI